MKIIYDSLGNPTQIFISVAEINYEIPFNPLTKEIEWQLIENKITRDLLKDTWQNLNVNNDVFKSIVPPATELIANWEGWNEFMFQDIGYNKAVQMASDQISRQRLEVLFLRRFFQPNMIILWNRFIESLPNEKTTLAEVEIWRNAVNSYNMPFSFTDAGLMIAREGA